jgi:hypothetical protein
MNYLSRAMRSNVRPKFMLAVVIAALCFSVGEGLQLTPFPLSTLATAKSADTQLAATASDQRSLHKYGPLDVPAQNQKRNKRQAVDIACGPTIGTQEIPAHWFFSAAFESVNNASTLIVFLPAGRAPPLSS